MSYSRPHRDVEKVFIHCSASDREEHDDVEVMRRWHTDPKPSGRGWSDVGYHYFIRKTGRLEEGRDLERTPAAQRGNNTGSIAICLHGLKQENFSGHQFRALTTLCKKINEVHDGQVTFHGHREVAAKDCPVFDYRRVLGLSTDGVMSMPPDADRQDDTVAMVSRPVLRRATKSDAVVILQDLLNMNGSTLLVDGDFGRATFEAVIAFQIKKKLTADGIVGPATWRALTGGR
jgi:N-acetylmuramoyl-L-alanine amidase